ncbi:DUF5908 family protein [Nocardioides ganghwensis]|jgi:hypothetical protein|uniref:DUF5908 family protein n=1 Tax=Nocardioides ganghwensis TaxID=252230 RepID=UPI001CD06783
MPVEINELHIRVSVVAPPTGRPAGAPTPPEAAGGTTHEALVAECVEHVLQVLSDRRDR